MIENLGIWLIDLGIQNYKNRSDIAIRPGTKPNTEVRGRRRSCLGPQLTIFSLVIPYMPTALVPNPSKADGATGGGSGGSSGNVDITTNDADPNAAGLKPADLTKGCTFTQDPSITKYNEWKWSPQAQTWVQIVSPT
jgi:hypothetical protein